MGTFTPSENQGPTGHDIKVEKWKSDKPRVPRRKNPSLHLDQRSGSSVFKDLAQSGHFTSGFGKKYTSDVEVDELPRQPDSAPIKSSPSKSKWGNVSDENIRFTERDPEAIVLKKEADKERKEKGQLIEIDSLDSQEIIPEKLRQNLKSLFDSTKIKATYIRDQDPRRDSIIFEGDEVRVTIPLEIFDKLTTRGREKFSFSLARPVNDYEAELLQDQLAHLTFDGQRLGLGPAELHIKDNRFDYHSNLDKISSFEDRKRVEDFLKIWKQEDIDQIKFICHNDYLFSVLIWGKKTGPVFVPLRPLLDSLNIKNYRDNGTTNLDLIQGGTTGKKASLPVDLISKISFGWKNEINPYTTSSNIKNVLAQLRIDGTRRADILTDQVKVGIVERYSESEISEPDRRQPLRPLRPIHPMRQKQLA